MGRARIIVAEDHPGLLECIAEMLEPDFDVVDRVRDGQALLEAANRWLPDVVITDITMPVMDGLEAARQLKDQGSNVKIVFLTIHQDQDFVRTALEVGASGYVVKCRLASDLAIAIQEALAGRQFVSPLG